MGDTKIQGRQLLLRAIYSEDNKNFRMDIHKSGISAQETIGILEIAKDKLMDEVKQKEVVAQKKA